MRPETGKTDAPASNDEMSIRRWSDGHSFPELPKGPLTVELLGRKTVLVPADLFRAGLAESFLAWSGLACDASERAVWSDERAGRVAVMAVAEQAFGRLPEKVRFSSPLLRMSEQPQSLVLELHEDLLYIKLLRGSELTLAEAVRAAGEADVLYYVGELARIASLKGLTLRLSGSEAAGLRTVLKSQFKRIVCE